MTRPRLLVTRRWPESVEKQLAERFDATFNRDDVALSREELAAALDSYDVICPTVSDKLDADLLAGAGKTRLLANYGVGYDHIDVEAAAAAGIAVTNTPGVLTDATADLALTLILMATRRTGEGERALRAGKWSGWGPMSLVGSSAKGKVLGIVGFGRIGQATARRAFHGLGMTIAYFGRHEAEAEIVRELDAGYHDDLHSLLAASDVVSLHVPGGEDTADLIDAAALAAMKPGGFLVNTARGGIVDHDALADALESGHLAGAGLDVYPEEPNVPPRLLDLENVVLLPHLGSADTETRIAMGEKAMANAVAWLEGRPLPDRVA